MDFDRYLPQADFDRYVELSERAITAVELVAAYILVALFAVGVFDLGLRIVDLLLSGRITDPQAVIGLIDVALLLFIIVEIYQTVVAYMRRSSERDIVRIVVYAGVIAMVRKAIIFRTGEFASIEDAFIAAGSYTLILFGLAAILLVNYRYTE